MDSSSVTVIMDLIFKFQRSALVWNSAEQNYWTGLTHWWPQNGENNAWTEIFVDWLLLDGLQLLVVPPPAQWNKCPGVYDWFRLGFLMVVGINVSIYKFLETILWLTNGIDRNFIAFGHTSLFLDLTYSGLFCWLRISGRRRTLFFLFVYLIWICIKKWRRLIFAFELFVIVYCVYSSLLSLSSSQFLIYNYKIYLWQAGRGNYNGND